LPIITSTSYSAPISFQQYKSQYESQYQQEIMSEETIDEVYNSLIDRNYNVKNVKIGNEQMIIFHDNLNVTSKDKYIFCEDANEFKQYLDFQNPTFDDVRRFIVENEKIDEQSKDIMIQCLNNLEQEKPDMDLTILGYNVRRMEIVPMSGSKIKEIDDNNQTAAAYWNYKEGKMIINSEAEPQERKIAIAHETSHAFTEAQITINDTKIDYITRMPIVTGKFVHIKYFANSLEEGKAEEFAKLMMGSEKFVPSYIEETKILNMLLTIADMDIEEFATYGTLGLVQKLDARGFNTADFIDTSDLFMAAHLGGVNITDIYNESSEVKRDIIFDYARGSTDSRETKKDKIQKLVDMAYGKSIEAFLTMHDRELQDILANSKPQSLGMDSEYVR